MIDDIISGILEVVDSIFDRPSASSKRGSSRQPKPVKPKRKLVWPRFPRRPERPKPTDKKF